ncbi:ribosomal L35, mitochondrial [Octopus vulgaris]|uniref:Large ribosomal subunit protein bL35m n=1 Tax=Octopus vulgaris TaxID=6645 RepID=A0AA36AJ91_OCTVU|nr:ribosomal L35, mitochondrial [Octopus vulgaris]
MACLRQGIKVLSAATQYVAKSVYSPTSLPSIISSVSSKPLLLHRFNNQKSLVPLRSFVSVCQPTQIHRYTGCNGLNQKLLSAPQTPNVTNIRNKIVCSYKKGRPKSSSAVVSRFYRLRSGLWIRARSGRSNKRWAKNSRRVFRLQETVFCNKTQSKKLERMVSRHWLKKRYFPDDPYEIYQDRSTTKFDVKKPLFFP